MPVVAPIIGAVAGIGGGILSANATKSAANTAAAAQIAAADRQIANQREQYQQTRSDLTPWMSAGSSAQDMINQLLGISTPQRTTTDWAAYVNGNPDALANWNAVKNTSDGAQFGGDINAFGQYHYNADGSRRDLTPYQTTTGGAVDQGAAIEALKSSPLYEALFRNGENTLLANASATGGLRGGNTERSLADFGSDTLAKVIQQQLGNLTGVSQQGQNAAGQVGNFGANAANQIGLALGDQGAAQAGAATAVGAANSAMAKDIAGSVASLAGNKDVQSWVGKLF